MSFPFIFQSSFDATLTTPFGWDSEADTGSRLDLAHVSELARFPWSQCAPYRGAYAMRVQMLDANDHTLTEGDLDIADTATAFASFYLYLAPDVAATADDVWNIYEFQQAAGTVEASLGLRITATTDVVEIGIGDGVAATNYATVPLDKNRWYHIEVGMLVSTGGAGTLTLYVDGASVVALTGLTNAAAVGSGSLGTQDTLSTTTGTLLFDQFVFDDLRVYPTVDRWPTNLLLTQSGQAFIGPGVIDNVSLLSGAGTDCILTVYDTGRGNTNDANKIVVELKNTANNELVDPAGMPVSVRRGAYVALSGTNPRALVSIKYGAGYGSAAVLRRAGLLERAAPNEG